MAYSTLNPIEDIPADNVTGPPKVDPTPPVTPPARGRNALKEWALISLKIMDSTTNMAVVLGKSSKLNIDFVEAINKKMSSLDSKSSSYAADQSRLQGKSSIASDEGKPVQGLLSSAAQEIPRQSQEVTSLYSQFVQMISKMFQ